jgi:hypothetical protein
MEKIGLHLQVTTDINYTDFTLSKNQQSVWNEFISNSEHAQLTYNDRSQKSYYLWQELNGKQAHRSLLELQKCLRS